MNKFIVVVIMSLVSINASANLTVQTSNSKVYKGENLQILANNTGGVSIYDDNSNSTLEISATAVHKSRFPNASHMANILNAIIEVRQDFTLNCIVKEKSEIVLGCYFPLKDKNGDATAQEFSDTSSLVKVSN